MDANTPYLELGIIDKLSSFINSEKLRLLMTCYLEDSQNILHRLSTVIADNNAEETTRLVHSLKSTSASVGAIRFSEMAGYLEQQARASKLDEVHARLKDLAVLFDSTRVTIEQLDFMQS